MKNIKIEVTQEELILVTTLLSDQLFRGLPLGPCSSRGDPVTASAKHTD